MSEQWFDNQAGLIDYIDHNDNRIDISSVSEQVLKSEIFALNEQYNVLKDHYFNTHDIDVNKKMHRIARKKALFRAEIVRRAETHRFDDELIKIATSNLREALHKQNNVIKSKDLRINKLLREVERYKKLYQDSMKNSKELKSKLKAK